MHYFLSSSISMSKRNSSINGKGSSLTFFRCFSFSENDTQTQLQKGFVEESHFQGSFFKQFKTPVYPSAVWQSLPWGGWRPKDTGCCWLAKHPHKCLPLGRSINICRLTDRRLQVSKNVALLCSQVSWRCQYNHWVGWRGSTRIHVAICLEEHEVRER